MSDLNFGFVPEEYCDREKSGIVILPVPYDCTSTWQKGADKGPGAIIAASEHMEWYDLETKSEVYKKGIFTANAVKCPQEPEEMAVKVQDAVSGYLREGKFPVVLGGEHSVTIGSARAFVEHFEDVTVLQLDAHSDMRDEYKDSKYNHACVMARVQEKCPVVQVGIRSSDIKEFLRIKEENVFWARDIYDNRKWFEQAIGKLTKNVYITIDLDVFDPSIMPSTGTPEPGGLFWYDVLAFLREVFSRVNVVGFDVVELCPNDVNKSPDLLAAKLVYTLLSYKYCE